MADVGQPEKIIEISRSSRSRNRSRPVERLASGGLVGPVHVDDRWATPHSGQDDRSLMV
jgi:hypothetical protein